MSVENIRGLVRRMKYIGAVKIPRLFYRKCILVTSLGNLVLSITLMSISSVMFQCLSASTLFLIKTPRYLSLPSHPARHPGPPS